jgi:hypothetical protein
MARIHSQVLAAIDHFHDLLRREHGASTYAELRRTLEEGGMLFHGRPICDVLRPMFLDGETYDRVQRAAGLVARGVTTISRLLAANPALRDTLGLAPEEESMIQMDPAEPTEPLGRLDGFLGVDGEIRFVEYNATPGGIVTGDELRGMYARLPVMEAFRRRYPTRAASTTHLVSDALLRTHHRKGGSGRPRLAVVNQSSNVAPDHPDEESLLLLDETMKLIQTVVAGGFELRVVDPQQLRYEDGALYADDFRVDAALVANWSLLASALDPGAPFYRAVRDRAIWVVNSASTAILRGHKSVFALLSDPAYQHLFEPEVAAALARHVPWTRRVQQGSATYRDRTVDLLPFIVEHRDELVLKPANDYGASGVVLGWQCDDSTWAAAIDRALARPHVVQERVSITSQPFPTMARGELQLEERYFTIDPFVWNDTEPHGNHVRLSRSAILNMSASDGSTTAMLILDEL